MIEITIRNFQSIEEVILNVNGFTTLVGKSNIGKSAVIRAVSSALLNLPVTGMVRRGASHCSVEIKSDSYHILWEKGEKGINRYTINGKVYDKVGSTVPEEIRQLGFKEVEIGSSSDTPWFASQFSPVFLLDKPGSQVTEFISEVSRLRVLQEAITMASKGKRSFGEQANQKSTQLKQVQTKLGKFADLDQVETLLKDLNAMKASIASYEDQEKQATRLASDIGRLYGMVDLMESALASGEVPEEISGLDQLRDLTQVSRRIQAAKNSESQISTVVGVGIPSNEMDQDLAYLAALIHAQDRKEAVSRLDHDTSVPEATIDIGHLGRLVSIQAEIDRLRQFTSKTVCDIPDSISFDLESIKALEVMNQGLKEAAMEIRAQMRKTVDLASEMKVIEEELSKIEVCPTCDRAM